MGKENIAKMLRRTQNNERNDKISIERMASLIGVTEEEMSRFETGESCIDVDSLFQFAYLFNVDPASFLYGVVNVNSGTCSSIPDYK
ncbi:helix-turn-helix domain-containing protein [Providencia hangzhouensis]|uniref:helix-turn-helix domain-containing protein n=1 Tax=Providencia hangzhouensis TaxID=3031799 RepID=UPI0034DD0B0B